MYVICEWIERYEVNKDGGSVKDRTQALKKSPLEYIRLKVHGRSQGTGYRRLLERCKSRAMEVFGIFSKMLEIAGCEERQNRGKILNERGEPATAADIAFILSVPVKKVQKALDDLVYLGWIEDVEIVQNSEDSAKEDALGEFAENPDCYITKRNETKPNITKHNETKTEQDSDFDKVRDSNSIRLEFDSKLRNILPPTSKSDNIAYRNLGIWLSKHNGSSRGLACQALQIAGEARAGDKPIALFFDLLKQRMSYNAAAEKEKMRV